MRLFFRATLPVVCFGLLLSSGAFAQHAVRHEADSTARYYRLICLVHFTGSGKQADPIRPEYVPSAADAARQGILTWSMQITDDKSMAVVHLVASNRHAFDAVLADTRPEIRVFEIGKDSRAAIEAEMQKHVKGFDLSKFAVVAR
jgi:hypothetical protein